MTPSRDALNGYQKGRCFYCFRDIRVGTATHEAHGMEPDLPSAEVDHFFPKALEPHLSSVNLDVVWNLVLSCP